MVYREPIVLIKKLKSSLDKDIHLSELLKGSMLTFLIKISGAIIVFLFSILLARTLDIKEVGIFYLALTSLVILSTLTRLGLDRAVFVKLSYFLGSDNSNNIKSHISTAKIVIFFASIMATITIIYASKEISSFVFEKEELRVTLIIMCIGIFPFSLMHLFSETLRAYKEIMHSQLLLASAMLVPVVVMLFNNKESLSLDTIAILYVVGLFMVSLYGLYVTKMKIGYNFFQLNNKSEIFEISNSLYIISIANMCMAMGGSFLVGVWGSLEEVGAYNVISRMAFLLNFVLISVNAVLSVQIGRLLAKNDINSVEKIVNKAVLLGGIVGLPLFILFMVFPEEMVSMFGEEYVPYSLILIILAIGQYFSLISGPVGNVLIMSGNEKLMKNIMLFSAFFLLVVSCILIILLGVIGAAIAFTLTIIIQNIIALYYVYTKLHIKMFFLKFI